MSPELGSGSGLGSSIGRDIIDAVVRDVMEQVPGMEVTGIHVLPASSPGSHQVLVRLDLHDGATVICAIDAEGRLQSASIVEV